MRCHISQVAACPTSLHLTIEICHPRQKPYLIYAYDQHVGNLDSSVSLLQNLSSLVQASIETSNMAAQVPARARTHQPCAACRMLRKRCDRDCVLAPYFPSHEVENFAGVHRVFGASNVIKMIQMVELSRRKDAVKALIYEARARIRDPVYGNAGAIFYMQKMIQDLKTQLDSTRTQTLALQEQRDQLLGILANVHRIDPVFPTDFPTFADGFLSIHDTASYEPSTFPSDHDQIV